MCVNSKLVTLNDIKILIQVFACGFLEYELSKFTYEIK